MKIYVEGGPWTTMEALKKLVDDDKWISGAALKRYVGHSSRTYFYISLVERKRWFGLFGPVEQIIRSYDALNHNDYYSRTRPLKAK